MKALRRMSPEQAVAEAMTLASAFFAGEDSKGFVGELGDPTPDSIETEKHGKVQRYWISLVRWSRDDAEIDGPSVIRIDLGESRCAWA